MRVTNINSQTYQPQFGAFLASEKAIAYMNRAIPPKKIEEVNKIIADQSNKRPNIRLYTGVFTRAGSNTQMTYLRATVGEETFKEGLFTSAYGVIKKAADYVDYLAKKKSRVRS